MAFAPSQELLLLPSPRGEFSNQKFVVAVFLFNDGSVEKSARE
jgi:hypothetical protein